MFKEEKESARRTARSHVTLEKSSKNYILCENEPSCHSRLPPHLLANCDGEFSTWWREMCELQAPRQLARFTRGMEGGGWVICKSMPFNNGSTDWTQIQSTILHSTGNTSVWMKVVGHSNTRGTVRPCSFPLKFTAAHSLHFQHLMWTKGYSFKTSTVKRSLISIVHVNS